MLRNRRGGILVTGVTGFLGSRLVAQLLRRTDSTVYCLVRGRSTEGAAKRVRARLEALGVTPGQQERAVPVFGDLSLPDLGLSPAGFAELADTVHTVFHCAAWLSLVATADRLTPINVGGTRSVVELAERGGGTTLHFVSTLGTLGSARRAGLPRVSESTAATHATTGGIGYTVTKMLAEDLVRDAGRRGVPVVIHRPGLIIGDSRTGVCLDNDILVRVMRAAIEAGQAPRCPGWMPVAPVDYVAEAIAVLAEDPSSPGSTFHLAGAAPFPVYQAFRHTRSLGYPLVDVGYAEWEQALRERMDRPTCFAVLAMWEAVRYLLGAEPGYLFPQICCDQTLDTLTRLGLGHPPEPDQHLFHRMLNTLARQGVLAPPGASFTAAARAGI
jgi:thioester reductase-like protein